MKMSVIVIIFRSKLAPTTKSIVSRKVYLLFPEASDPLSSLEEIMEIHEETASGSEEQKEAKTDTPLKSKEWRRIKQPGKKPAGL